jgi:hypothetical protein
MNNEYLGEVVPGVHLGQAGKAVDDYKVGDWTLTFQNTPFVWWEMRPQVDPSHDMSDDQIDALSEAEFDLTRAWMKTAGIFADSLDGSVEHGWELVEACRKAGYDLKEHGRVGMWLWHRMGVFLDNREKPVKVPPDCGDNSCLYADPRTGMRTNSGCRCDECPKCGGHVRPGRPVGHRKWCPQRDWVPEHHKENDV